MFSLITAIVQKSGLVGVALLMLLENLLPVIPSELIMPMAGFQAARGAFSPLAAVLAGAAGSILGGFAWYGFGRRLGADRLRRWAAHGGRWLTLTPLEVTRAEQWFGRWGAAAVCIGRALPGVRGVICIPAGLARMPIWTFLIASSAGAVVWSGLLVWAGVALNAHFEQVDRWLNPVTDALLALLIVGYLIRVLRYKAAG